MFILNVRDLKPVLVMQNMLWDETGGYHCQGVCLHFAALA
jgi:hypothetical protein